MNATAAAVIRGNSRALVITTLGALALAAAWFVVKRALPYFDFSPDQYGPHFWPRRWWLALHVAGGVIALTTGIVQLWLGLTNRTSTLHRSLGKLYLAAIVLGSIGGFYLALEIEGNAPFAAGLFSLCVAWVVTTAMAVLAIKRRNLLQHREWMLRSFAVTFAFVTFRVGVDSLIAWQLLSPPDALVIMSWACWAMPLLALEPLIQVRKVRGH